MSLQMYVHFFCYVHVFACYFIIARCELTVGALHHPPPLKCLSTLVISCENRHHQQQQEQDFFSSDAEQQHLLAQNPIRLILRSSSLSFHPFNRLLPSSAAVTSLSLHFPRLCRPFALSSLLSVITRSFRSNLCTLELDGPLSAFADHVLLHSANLTTLIVKTCALPYCICDMDDLQTFANAMQQTASRLHHLEYWFPRSVKPVAAFFHALNRHKGLFGLLSALLIC